VRLIPGDFIETSAILFDMDGTLVDSTEAIKRVWCRWAERHGINAAELFAALHGVRISETVQKFAPPQLDVDAEVAGLMAAERAEVDGTTAIAGARKFLDSLPPSSWALVTSADRSLLRIRMAIAGLPLPAVVIAAEDVAAGKPDPEGYLKAAERLHCKAGNAIVFEDSNAGLEAGRAAGFRAFGISATLNSAFPEDVDWIVDFNAIKVESISDDGTIFLRVIG
jgi:sugar-phosphatase